MAQQQPPQANYPPNYGYMQQPQQVPQQNGNQQQQQTLPNGFPPASALPPMKPMQAQSQQLPPQQTINYQNFQTKAIQPGAGVNGSNSALSSRTSSPGVQQPTIPQSQLPPSRSYPSYQQLHGTPYQQQAQPVSSQLPMAPLSINNNNIIGNENKTNFAPNPMNVPSPQQHAQPAPMMAQQQQLSSSMKNLTMNPGVPGSYPTPPMPASKSDHNILNNNNNAPGMISNPAMPPKTNTMAKRPLYPTQPTQPAMAPIAQQQRPFQQPQQQPQLQQGGFNSFPAGQPQVNQQPPQQPGNLQYQNFPQPQPQPQQQQQPAVSLNYPAGSIVSQGFNRMWGNESVDLMQHRHILPPTKVLPPTVKLNHQFHEATNCSTDIFRCTLTKIPESNSLLQKSRLPLGILIHPYRDLSVS